MRIPLSGVSEAQREHFRSIQQCYNVLKTLLPYASFSRLPDDEQLHTIDRAKAFMDLVVVGDDEKFEIVSHLRLLKTKSTEFKVVQEPINAILDKWEERNNAHPQ